MKHNNDGQIDHVCTNYFGNGGANSGGWQQQAAAAVAATKDAADAA